jgi:hypothetical protein
MKSILFLLLFVLIGAVNINAQNNCINFKSGDYIDLGSTLPTQMANDTACTIEFWFKGVNLGQLTFSGNVFNVGFNSSSSSLQFYMNNHTAFALNGANIVLDNSWHHLAYVFNAGKEFTIYIDGIAYAKRIPLNVSLPNFSNSTSAVLSNFNGSIDEFRVWNYARTETQINDNMYCGIQGAEPNLLLNLKFDQGVAGGNNNTTTIAFDSSGNNINGVLFGFTLNGATSNWVSIPNKYKNIVSQLSYWSPPTPNLFKAKSATLNFSSVIYNQLNEMLVSIKDDSSGNKCSVLRKVGDSLLYVGQPGFSNGVIYSSKLTMDSSHNLIVICHEATMLKAYKLVANNWVYIGQVGSTYNSGNSNYYDVAIGNNDTIFVAFADSQYAYKAGVKKFDGITWNSVGNSILSIGAVNNVNLEMDNTGIPNFMFSDLVSGTTYNIKTLYFTIGLWTSYGNSTIVSNNFFDFKINPITNKKNVLISNSYTLELKEYTTSWVNTNTLSLSSSVTNIIYLKYDINNLPIVYGYINGNYTAFATSGSTFTPIGYISSAMPYGSPGTLLVDNNGDFFILLNNLNLSATVPFSYKGAFLLKYYKAADMPNLANIIQCGANSTNLIIPSSTKLNSNTQWVWYTSICPKIIVGYGPSLTVNPTQTTTYFVRGEGTAIPSAFDSILVKKDTFPILNFVISDDTVCVGKPVNILASGSNSYLWTGGISNGANFTPLSSTIYTVTATNTGSCSTTSVVSIVVNPKPIVQATASDSTVCKGDSIIFNGNGANTYIWSSTVQNNIPFKTINQGTSNYTVTGTDLNGCSSTSVISVQVSAAYTISIGNDTNICAGDYLFINPGIHSSYLWNDGSTTATHVLDTTGLYFLTTTNSIGCKAKDSINITLQPIPITTLTTSKTLLCENEGPLTLTGVPSGGLYSGTGVSANKFYPASAGVGTYNIVYTYTNNYKCVGKDTVQLEVQLCTNINDLNSKNTKIQIYPNPGNGNCIIESLEKGQLKLLNNLGQVVYTATIFPGTQHLDIQLLPNGIYSAIFCNTNNIRTTIKIVKTN